jgi:Zn-finger nucleic acid-binding protein
MKCPVCKVSTTAVEHDKIELDYCSVCHGIWFDRGELELLLDTMAGGTTRELVKSLMQKPQQQVAEKNRKCPICRRSMRKIDTGSNREIIIDVCNSGHGLWFDGGESGAFIRQLQLEHPDTASPLYKALYFISDAFRVDPGAPGSS